MTTPETDSSNSVNDSNFNNNNNEKTLRYGGRRPNEPRGPLPDEKFCIDYAVALWTQIENCDPKDKSDAPWLVESLRSAAELALWGDKNNHEVADYLIMESTIVSHIADIISMPGLDHRIYVQCIQSVVILLQNHSRESTLFFILSNGKFNRIIEAKLDYGDEEIVSHFVSFLKTVTLRLQSKNILPLFCNGGAFPLLAAAMNSALLTHDDRMVRTSVRQVIAQLLRLKDAAVQQFAQGCIPRLLDDLGAFLEAQLRNLALYVADESASANFVEMMDEDVHDEGLYLQDLLAGYTDVAERAKMMDTLKQYILDRLLSHAQDADSSDLVASTVVFLFLSRWLRSAPKWFLIAAAANNEDASAFDNSPLLKALSWALLVPSGSMSHHPGSTVARAALTCLGTLFHKLTDGDVKGCCCTSKESEWRRKFSSAAAAAQDGNDVAIEKRDSLNLVTQLGLLLQNSLQTGFARKVDRTSGYNFAAIFYVASTVFDSEEQDQEEKKKNDDDNAEKQHVNEKNKILLSFFDAIVKDSDLFSVEQSALRLEVMMLMMSTSADSSTPISANENPCFFPESTLNLFIRDQWSTFVDDLRYPLKRTIKFRSPISQQERLTHRAAVIAHLLQSKEMISVLNQQKSEKNSSSANAIRSEMNRLASRILQPPPPIISTAAADQQQQQENTTISGTLVNEEVSPEGGLPTVFLAIEGNTLKIMRIEFGQLFTKLINENQISQNSGASATTTNSSSKDIKKGNNNENNNNNQVQQFSIQHLPLVALQITADVSRPFVVHFCTPTCCKSAPFSVSFASRKVAAKILNVVGEASKTLREKTRLKFQETLSLL
jgi:hypothetical protein